MTKKAQKHNFSGDASIDGVAEPISAGAAADPVEAVSAPSSEEAPVLSPQALQATSTSKQDTVIALMQRGEGASLDELVAATGWQKHSVRGLISGALKKNLGLTVETEKTAEGTVYRIAATAGGGTNAV
ncbi:DUF3489 domain-containing protein [Asticcacaulis solisilvae]|uniref:DUF3489 domain-containing protein n=1 Tax=Asticcacaulis solisilvae TaxID=1217274 RepID=UPI003FD7828C